MNANSSPLLRGLPARLGLSLQLISAALATYFWLTFAGPYRWLAERQMEWFDGYYAIVTWAFTLLVFFVPLGASFQLARRLGVIGSAAQPADPAQTERVVRATAFMQHHRLSLGLMLGSLGLLFFDARDWWIAQRGAELETFAVQALEAGSAPHGSHLEVQAGEAAWDAYIEWRDGHSTAYYVPFVSAEWQEGAPVGAMLLLDKNEFDTFPRNTSTFRGAVMPETLPTPVQVSFREAGFETKDSLVLSVGVDPRSMGDMVGVVAAVSGVLFACGAGLFWWQRRRG
jgi:hypothetical protein